MRPPAVEDMLLFAEAILGVPADDLLRAANVPLAESALAAPFAGFQSACPPHSPAEQCVV